MFTCLFPLMNCPLYCDFYLVNVAFCVDSSMGVNPISETGPISVMIPMHLTKWALSAGPEMDKYYELPGCNLSL